MSAEAAVADFAAWARERALPLWAGAGFDNSGGRFEEQLDLDGRPVRHLPLRLMVQARQVASFALASLRGWHPAGRALALEAGSRMIARYWAADGAPGWVFALDREHRPVRPERDLYAHAFALFALAWLIRLAPEDASFRNAASATLDFLDGEMADPAAGGYRDALPRPDAKRRQNPHMHLFEALLELHAATGDRAMLGRAARLRQLALARFVDGTTGLLHEVFDDAWGLPEGWDSAEPGHQFEWAWLLRRHEALAGAPDPAAARLVEAGLRCGFDPATGRVVDEIGGDGSIRRASSRLWPHAEALRVLAGDRGVDRSAAIAALLRRLRTRYCPDRLGGGWIDQLDTADTPQSTTMPASSLYHLIFALDALTA